MTSHTGGNCSSALHNIIIGSHVERHCILLCELTLCSSLMIVFLWMRSTWILVIWIQNKNICPCPKRNHIYCKCPFNISHLWKILFLFLTRQGENWLCIFTYCHFNCFSRENQFPNIYNNGCKICKVWSMEENINNLNEYSLEWWGCHETFKCLEESQKIKLLKWVLISMMRLLWNIQLFRTIINRSAIKYYLH